MLDCLSRKSIMSTLFGSESAEQRFVPFVRERDSVGRILESQRSITQKSITQRSKTQSKVRKLTRSISKKNSQKRQDKISFKLKLPKPDQKITRCEFSQILFPKMDKIVRQWGQQVKQVNRPKPLKLVNSVSSSQLRLFYDRDNYEKFHYKKSPTAIFLKQSAETERPINTNNSITRPDQLTTNKKCRRVIKQSQINSQNIDSYIRELKRRKQQIQRLQSKFYPEVESELSRIDKNFTLLKHKLLHLRSQTTQLAQTPHFQRGHV